MGLRNDTGVKIRIGTNTPELFNLYCKMENEESFLSYLEQLLVKQKQHHIENNTDSNSLLPILQDILLELKLLNAKDFSVSNTSEISSQKVEEKSLEEFKSDEGVDFTSSISAFED